MIFTLYSVNQFVDIEFVGHRHRFYTVEWNLTLTIGSYGPPIRSIDPRALGRIDIAKDDGV